MCMEFMRLSLDPKSIGAFIEYTLKPLIDYSRDLLEEIGKHGLIGKDVLKSAAKLYILDRILCLLGQVIVTGMICFTVLHCLHTGS